MKSSGKKHLNDYAYPIVIVIVAMVIVAIIAVIVYKKRDKVEAQRTAKVIEINGPCTVLREGAIINATADMPLYSGDTFYSGIDASARIMIDDDKFLWLDSTTRINFTASGTPDDTHTLIYVQTGSMLTEVKEKLVDGESFDIVTPNSFMEIHGTKTLTRVVTDDAGMVTTSAAVLQGSVLYNTVLSADGKALIIPETMSAGDSLAVSVPGEALAGDDVINRIVEKGSDSDGTAPGISSYEDAGVVRGEHCFDNDLIDRVNAVLAVSQQEDLANGSGVPDADGNGVNDSIDNADALRRRGEGNAVSDAGDQGGAKPDEVPLPGETAGGPENEEIEGSAAGDEEADGLDLDAGAGLTPEQIAEARRAEEQRTQEILAVEAAIEQVNANLQAIAEQQTADRLAAQQAQWEQQERERQEREAAQNSSATSSDDPGTPPSAPLVEGDVDTFGNGTFTGTYNEDGYPIYERNGEYYYLTEQSESGIHWIAPTDPTNPTDPTDPTDPTVPSDP